jgi:hypothetical protein
MSPFAVNPAAMQEALDDLYYIVPPSTDYIPPSCIIERGQMLVSSIFSVGGAGDGSTYKILVDLIYKTPYVNRIVNINITSLLVTILLTWLLMRCIFSSDPPAPPEPATQPRVNT